MDAPRKPTKGRFTWPVILMLALPYAGLCFPALYVRATPALIGIPFFYWYQFVWVVITSLLLIVVYHRLKRTND